MEKGSGGKGCTAVSQRWNCTWPIKLQKHNHMTLLECNNLLSLMYTCAICACICMRSYGSKWRFVSNNIINTHKNANYCIPQGHSSRPFSPDPFSLLCRRGWRARLDTLHFRHPRLSKAASNKHNKCDSRPYFHQWSRRSSDHRETLAWANLWWASLSLQCTRKELPGSHTWSHMTHEF
jgi:hypothetical protein